MYSPIVLEGRSPKLASLVESQNVGRTGSFWGEYVPLPLLPLDAAYILVFLSSTFRVSGVASCFHGYTALSLLYQIALCLSCDYNTCDYI